MNKLWESWVNWVWTVGRVAFPGLQTQRKTFIANSNLRNVFSQASPPHFCHHPQCVTSEIFFAFSSLVFTISYQGLLILLLKYFILCPLYRISTVTNTALINACVGLCQSLLIGSSCFFAVQFLLHNTARCSLLTFCSSQRCLRPTSPLTPFWPKPTFLPAQGKYASPSFSPNPAIFVSISLSSRPNANLFCSYGITGPPCSPGSPKLQSEWGLCPVPPAIPTPST